MKKLSEINDEDLGKEVYVLSRLSGKIIKGVVCVSHKVTFEDWHNYDPIDFTLCNPIRKNYKNTDRFEWIYCKIEESDDNVEHKSTSDIMAGNLFLEDTTFEKCSDACLIDGESKVCFSLSELKEAFIESKKAKIKDLMEDIDNLNRVIDIVESEGIEYYINTIESLK